MRAFILMACLAYAAAEAGYSYNNPGHSGGSGNLGGSIGGFSGGLGHSGSLGVGSLGGQGHGGFSGVGHGGFSGAGNGGFGGQGDAGFGGSGAGGFGGSGAGGFGGSGAGFGGQAIVQKHIYVHVAPQEDEIVHHTQVAVPQAQKHYKIIFIKAPSGPQYQAPIIPVQPQNEEKTLVYVLVKKPEHQQDIVIPAVAPTQPSKPEVYFIKYNTQKEVVNGGGAGIGAGLGASIGNGQGLGGLGGSGDLGLGSGSGFGSDSGLGSGILSGSGSGLGNVGFGSSGPGPVSSEYGVPRH